MKILLTLFASCGIILALEERSGSAAGQQPTEAVRALLVERLDTLRSIEESIRQRHKVGTTSLDALHQAVLERLEAELDLAVSGKARVALLEKQLKEAEALENMARKRYQASTASDIDVLRARAYRLEFQVALARERAP